MIVAFHETRHEKTPISRPNFLRGKTELSSIRHYATRRPARADATPTTMTCAFELERQARIDSNRKRMLEMGIVGMARDLAKTATPVKRNIGTVRGR